MLKIVYNPETKLWEKAMTIKEKIQAAILADGQKKVYVDYCAAGYDEENDDEPIDNLDQIAVKGKVVFLGDDYWEDIGEMRSEVMENPTWLQVAVCCNRMLESVKGSDSCYLEDIYKVRDEGDVQVYSLGMGS